MTTKLGRQRFVQIAVGTVLALGLSGMFLQRCHAEDELARTLQHIDQLPSQAPSFLGLGAPGSPNIEITVNRTRFSLPREYVLSATLEGHPGFILVASWPDMQSASPTITQTNSGSVDAILVWADSSLRPAQEALDTLVELKHRDNVGPTQVGSTTWGLREFRAIGLRDGYDDNISREDYFVPIQSLDTPVHIFCVSRLAMPPGGRGRQMCTELTVFDGVRIEVRFDRMLLDEWSDIHTRSLELLRRFAVEPLDVHE